MRFCSIVVILVSALGCGTVAQRMPDAATTQTICPDHPEQCQGKCCGTQCLDTDIDPLNCGDCNQQCPMGTICQGGHCGCPPNGLPCGMGQTCCGSLGCVSLDSDIRNCGMCGTQCGDGATCASGKCLCGGVMCASGETCCGGTCMSACASMPTADMATNPNAPPPGSCSCSDQCAGDPTHDCVNTNCCWVNGFIARTCNPKGTCAPYTYP